MSGATMIGKRSDFFVSAQERDVMAEVNSRVPDCTATMFHREGAEPLSYLVLSCGSRRWTFIQQRPFNDAGLIVEKAEKFVRGQGTRSSSAQYTDNPDDADLSPFAE